MTQPAVNLTELDGALGVLPPSAGKLLALVGVSTAGPLNTPATFGRTREVIATFGGGPLVEAACLHLEQTGRPVVLVRTGQSVAGTTGTLDDGDWLNGSSQPAINTEVSTPNDDYEAEWKAVKGGTIGIAGITFVWSLDGGRTWSPETALGTADHFEFPGTDLTFQFDAGTVVTDDTARTRTTAPRWNTTELGAALTALQASSVQWEIVHPVGAIDGDAFDLLETRTAALRAAGKYRAWIGNTRMPNVNETEAAYRTALDAIFATRASTHGGLCAGACKITSSVTGRKYRRPIAFAVASRQASVSEEIDIADINLGPLLGVSIRDGNGNPDEHDESLFPGLDDSRFITLRTWDDVQGVYVNRPRLFAPSGSDFELFPHRRVMNLAHGALRAYFLRRLNRPVQVHQSSGFILEEEALEIESGAREVLRATLLAKPKASAVQFALSRTDNLLSTKTLTGDARIIPLAYTEFIDLSVGFSNPALLVQAV